MLKLPELNQIFSENGCIAKNLNGYETRPQQIQMALGIQNAIESEKHLVVEAGTGVGKSLAYLVPFIQWSVKEKKRVIITTNTKTLQEQLINKDLPFLENALGLDFKYVLCVGSENYLCLRRLRQTFQYGLFDSPAEVKQINTIATWKENTDTGIKLDLDFEPKDKIWLKICRESDLCIGKNCQFRGECFYNKSRILQSKANILVVNHHLFFANIASAGKVLPNYDAVVFDEAQSIEDVATEYLGIKVSNGGLKYILDSIFSPRTGKGIISRLQDINPETKTAIMNCITEIHPVLDNFFASVVDEFGTESVTKRVRTPHLLENILEEPLKNLYNVLKMALSDISNTETIVELSAFADRILGISTGLKVFIEQSYPDYVYWIEIVHKIRYLRVSLHAAPLDISGILKDQVFNLTSPVILTSATLSINKSFKYIKSRVGLENSLELLLDSPFDYEKQAVLYIPDDLPDPSYEFDKFQEQIIKRVKEIIDLLGGRTFVLFTSYRTLEYANEYLNRTLTNITILKQGDMPRWQMIETFKQNKKSVLLGTNTFWQGVDIPGEALQCVIITKLPFAVPDNPLTEAKMEFLAQQGKDPFINYQVPQAIIMLKQGFGRLIRTKTDRGIVAILDPRIKTRFYGKWFIGSLPKCQLVSQLTTEGTEKRRKKAE